MMNFRYIIERMVSVAAMLLLALFVSCTEVGYMGDSVPDIEGVDNQEQSTMSVVDFEIAWPAGVASADIPDYVMVLMNRIQNTTVHYVFKMDGTGTVLESFETPSTDEPSVDEPSTDEPSTGEMSDGNVSDEETDGGDGSEDVESEEDGESEDGETEEGGESGEDGDSEEDGEVSDSEENPEEEPEVDQEPEGLKIFNGQYSVAALAVEDFHDFDVSALERYGETVSADYGMKDIYVTIPQLTENEQEEQSYIDFNPMYPYIRNVGEFWYVRPSNDTHKFISSVAGSDNTVRLVPQKLTRPINFYINIDLEEGVIVKRCVGTISGVPQRVQLMTGSVDDKNTGKMPFEMYRGAGNIYEGSINAFGLFPSDEPALIVGKGILTVILHASVENEDVVSNRIFYASLPISDHILAAEIMKYEEMTGYTFSGKDSYSIKVDKTLEVTREMVLSGANEGYEEWVRNEDDGNPDINPGLNPEL